MHSFVVSKDNLVKAAAGKKGAIARNALYGNPGTRLGRGKGGAHSVRVNQDLDNNFKKLKIVKEQKLSEELAEFLGIMLGDGQLAKNQFIITLHAAEREYYEYVSKLIELLFEDSPSKYSRRNIIELCLSGKGYIVELVRLGLQVGNKVANGVSLPGWTVTHTQYCKAVLRGLFDTDGSVYLDKHTVKNREYHSIYAEFTSHSKPLLQDIYVNLQQLGFSPTRSSKWRIIL